MVLGAGLGDVGDHVGRDASFTHFHEELDARRRARMLDEALEIIAGLWSGEPFSFHGEHFTVEEVTFVPTPVQQPRIPIWIGGGYPKPGPTRRAARWDGSMLYRVPGHDLSPDDVRVLREAAGERPYDIAVGGRARDDDLEAERERLRAVAAAGATWVGRVRSSGHPRGDAGRRRPRPAADRLEPQVAGDHHFNEVRRSEP
jgi:alkanesulfonate monooxygenase SsuD/methylene tetrahydromethanopterin reductase-like flavin-dependent oxidoreductase (luciferase family)